MDVETESKRGNIPIPLLSRADIAFHATGVALNGAWTVWGATWLALQWTQQALSGYTIAAILFVSVFLSDFFSGLLHWGFDTWFSEDTPFMRRVVLIVREHHVYPQNIFKYKFYYEAGAVSWASLAHTMPVIGLVTLTPGPHTVIGYSIVAISVVVSLFTLFMLQFHKLGHRRSQSRLIRLLQKAHLLMSVRHHGQHHRDNHDTKYCLINGWADLVLDRIGFWRAAERAIHVITGAVPRDNDHVWMKRYGRRKEAEPGRQVGS